MSAEPRVRTAGFRLMILPAKIPSNEAYVIQPAGGAICVRPFVASAVVRHLSTRVIWHTRRSQLPRSPIGARNNFL